MRIILFNHFHRGDLFTHKEFARHLKSIFPSYNYEYWHYNHPKVNLDLNIPLTNLPNTLDNNVKFYDQGEVIAINTWIGVWKDIFARHGGVNLQSLYESWEQIFDKLGAKLYDDPERYLPEIDYSYFNVKKVDEFVTNNDRKKILICNGKPMSNQSFESDMSEVIEMFAKQNDDVDFICTKKIKANAFNIFCSDDIIQDTEQFFTGVNPYWFDRPQNTCDLNEISYLSTKCDAIVGKNSGPFVFCETGSNLKDESKIIVSFCKGPNETMSNGVNIKCNYKHITDHSDESIYKTFEWVINETKN
jgi:hypothetical protein